jgi:hypothetical protein
MRERRTSSTPDSHPSQWMRLLLSAVPHFVTLAKQEKIKPKNQNDTMSDDLSKRRPQDANKISTTEDYEVRDWSKRLGCSPTELKDAVKEVGHSADKVRDYLSKKKRD